MPALHLIQNQTDPKLLPGRSDPVRMCGSAATGALRKRRPNPWSAAGSIFHKAQAKPAFFGGELLGYRVADEDPYAGRIILIFRPDPNAKGTTTSRDGWSMEKKIIFDEGD